MKNRRKELLKTIKYIILEVSIAIIAAAIQKWIFG